MRITLAVGKSRNNKNYFNENNLVMINRKRDYTTKLKRKP